MPELSHRRRLLVLAICCLSLFIVGLDATIVNLALPSLRADLDASVSSLQWVLDSYTLVLASLLILAWSPGWAGGRSSESTCRSGWPPSCWPRCSSSAGRAGGVPEVAAPRLLDIPAPSDTLNLSVDKPIS